MSSILQLAIQGKLVEQRPEEGTAEELYRQIQAEKQALIKTGKIKKQKPLPEITEDEIPFEIPEAWKWVRLGDCTSYAHTKEKVISTEIDPESWSLDLEDIEKESGKIVNYCKAGKRSITGDKVIFHKGQILYSKLRPYLKKILVAPQDGICTPELVPFWAYGGLDAQYIVSVLRAPHVDFAINAVTYGVKMPRVGTETMVNLLVPLPPLAEQKRIVAKIEELLPLIERYEKAWSRLEDFNKRFPGDMQKSILQMAIQGKLVEQRPEEGTGEELYHQIQTELKPLIQAKRFKGKKLPELSDDELPFEIPSSWKWVRLGDIISIESGKNLTSSQMRNGSVPVYGGNGITGYHDESLVHEETVVIGRVGFYCGSVHVTEKEAWITDNAFITTYPFISIDRSFLVYMLRHMDLGRDNNATAQPVVSGKKIYPLAFPLPPLAEQKRIVARLEELLPLCEKMK